MYHLKRKTNLLLGLWLAVFASLFYSAANGQKLAGTIAVPELLRLDDGRQVTTVKQWEQQRRPELLHLLTKEMYGSAPAAAPKMIYEIVDNDSTALNGQATRKQIRIHFGKQKDAPVMEMLLYVPNQIKGKVPVVLGLNFNGNQSVSDDPGIHSNPNWMSNSKGIVNNRATEASRGSEAAQWPIKLILSRGYAVATIYRGDIDPDFDDGFKNGVHALYPELQNRGDNFATIAAWAWGLSRGLDYLLNDKKINAKKVAVFGFSRLGKAALWAGATDPRFKLVISNESGAGGAKLFHCTGGEDVARLVNHFPYWFNNNFKKYVGRDTLLPFDQHMVIALIAPRPVYVASAIDDTNSNPKGEFLGLWYAQPAYRLYGKRTLPLDVFPPLNSAIVTDCMAYHVRAGGHNVTEYDWQQYLSFMDQHFKK